MSPTIAHLALPPEVEQHLRAAFAGWSEVFRRKLSEEGIEFLFNDYSAIIRSLETRSCSHGPNGTTISGPAWQSCCGISYEYLNDIACRTALATILQVVPTEALADDRVRLQRLDDRLHALYEHPPDRTGTWWANHLPGGVIP